MTTGVVSKVLGVNDRQRIVAPQRLLKDKNTGEKPKLAKIQSMKLLMAISDFTWNGNGRLILGNVINYKIYA